MTNLSELPRELWLVGRICSGKDYVGDVLESSLGYWKMGVGELIAAELEQAHALVPGFIYSKTENKNTWRQRLQDHGNLRRGEDPFYWLKAWIKERNKHLDRPAVMTSTRFIREGQVGIARGAFLIKLEVPEPLRQARIKQHYPNYTPATELNPAEGEIDQVPYHAHMPGDLPPGKIRAVIALLYKVREYQRIHGTLPAIDIPDEQYLQLHGQLDAFGGSGALLFDRRGGRHDVRSVDYVPARWKP